MIYTQVSSKTGKNRIKTGHYPIGKKQTIIYNKFQTVIPAEIRKEFNLDKTDKIEWRINDKSKVELEFIENLTLMKWLDDTLPQNRLTQCN